MTHFFIIFRINKDSFRFVSRLIIGSKMFDILEENVRYRRLIGRPRQGFRGVINWTIINSTCSSWVLSWTLDTRGS